MKKDKDSVFVKHSIYYDNSIRKFRTKEYKDPSDRILFLLSKPCNTEFFENIPKTFTITTKNTTLHFNIDMLKETSPVISKFVQENPNENNYQLNITDDDNILSKIEQLYCGQNVIFKEEELPIIQRFTQILQIKGCPSELNPKNAYRSNEVDSDGYNVPSTSIDWGIKIEFEELNVEIYQNWLKKFLTREEYQTFKIITSKKEYKCNIFAVYTSNVIRKILEKDTTIKEFVYNFDDKNDEFQIICDFFNYKQIDIKNADIDSLKSIAKDLQINCITKAIDDFNEHQKQFKELTEKHENVIKSIEQLFDLLYNINEYGIEKVKDSIVQSKWSKKEENVQELAAFILQVVKPSFSLQKEMAELLIQLNKEANSENRLDILIPFIVERLMSLYWPQNSYNRIQGCSTEKEFKRFIDEIEQINLNNRCVYSFIRILFKRGIIPKEEIIKGLTNYGLYNNTLNAFFLPELVEIDHRNFNMIALINRKGFKDNFYAYMRKNIILNMIGPYFYLQKVVQNYLPDKIDLYEKMLDSMEPDDEITKSLRYDDVDTLQRIINQEGIDINQYKVKYNIFEDFEEDQSLINYSAHSGSIKCFKYLILNEGEIDETTFYFSIYGGNNEIIKIVDQKRPKEKPKEDKKNIFSNTFKIDYIDINIEKDLISFWFYLKSLKWRTKFLNQYRFYQLGYKYDKYNDDNIQNRNRINDIDSVVFLNCCNINNIIAPTIAMHRNELFDWTFENLFANKSKYGKELKHIATLSAINGNVHSLITLIENGFHVTKDIISWSSKNGFYSLTKLLLDLYEEKTTEKSKSFDYKSIVDFDNLSIFKLFINRMNQFNLIKAILRAIKKNCMTIIKYVFDNIDKFDFIIFDEDFLCKSLSKSLRTKTDKLFSFLIDQFKKLSPELITFDLFSNLLNQACLNSNLPATKIITDFILNEDSKYDFTDAFFVASSSKSSDICQYFIDQQVNIDFVNNSHISDLGLIDITIYEQIINKVDPELQSIFLEESISKAIESKNAKVIEFILNKRAPRKTELIESVLTEDAEIVNLILKYNSRPTFINQKSEKGTALIIAVLHKNLEIVKRLLSIPEIDPSLYDYTSEDPLTIAVKNHDIDIIDAILNFYGDDIQSHLSLIYNAIDFIQIQNMRSNEEISQVEWDILKKLLKMKSINPNYTACTKYPTKPESFLYIACYDNRIDIVEFLLSLEKIDTNLYDKHSYDTPLMISLERTHTKIAKLLIKHPKTNINLRNRNNESALLIAVKKELPEIIEILIQDERFDDIESDLNAAFIYSNNEISKQLYSIECLDVNQMINTNNQNLRINALMQSVLINDIEKIDMIIQHRTFNIYKSRVKETIFIAVENNNIKIFEKLMPIINNNYNIINKSRQSLLEVASHNLSVNIIEEIFNTTHFIPTKEQILYSFVQSYSNKDKILTFQQQYFAIMDRYNEVQYRSIFETNQEILNQELLPEKSTIIEIMTKIIEYDNEHEHFINFDELLPNGKTFFTIIAKDFPEIAEVTEFLISHGADPNKSDSNNITPLEHGIKIKSNELVLKLLNTTNIEYCRTKKGNTYLHYACNNDETNILRNLLEKNVIDINSVNEHDETALFEACRSKCIDNINLLFKNDNLDYLHKNKDGKDALDILIQLPSADLESIKQDREKFHNKLISVINEKLNSND